jgi:hypothetical protein
MVIKSTNINKTNNHLSPKECLNSDGHQVHQYQQNNHLSSSQLNWNMVESGIKHHSQSFLKHVFSELS